MNEGNQETTYGVGQGGIPRGGGRGFAFGGRRGRGLRHAAWMSAPPLHMTKAQEIAALKEQASLLQENLQQVNARLEALSADTEKD